MIDNAQSQLYIVRASKLKIKKVIDAEFTNVKLSNKINKKNLIVRNNKRTKLCKAEH